MGHGSKKDNANNRDHTEKGDDSNEERDDSNEKRDRANMRANTEGDNENNTDKCGEATGDNADNNAANTKVVGHDKNNSDGPREAHPMGTTKTQGQALTTTMNPPTNDTACDTTADTGMGYALYC